jgi:threonine dehydrogenase-like Zn-dependent dehydrogenase
MMGYHSQCGGKVAGGWMLGNYLDGCQAEFFVIPNAQANIAVIPDKVSDEELLLVPDIVSTGFSAAEQGNIRIGDTVVVFAQGPIGLCATAGARLLGAGLIIAVDPIPARREKAMLMGADLALDPKQTDVVSEVLRLTGGAGADVALECLGSSQTLAGGLACTRPGATISSVGIYSKDILLPLEGFGAGLAEKRIVTSTCPGGRDRMARLIRIIETGRVKFDSLVTHRFKLDDIERAYELFASQDDGVIKVAITP